jgi:hypothetical protein
MVKADSGNRANINAKLKRQKEAAVKPKSRIRAFGQQKQ